MIKGENIKRAKVLVTGASGFIGSVLAKKLLELDAEVYGVSRNEMKTYDEIKWYKGDLSNLEFVETLIREIRPDYIYHMASHVLGARDYKYVLSTFNNNLVTALNLLLTVYKYPCKRIILGGSFEEFDPSDDIIIPSAPYAAAKFAASNYARMFHKLYDTPVCMASIYMVYGPGQIDLTKLVPYVTLKTLKGETPELTSGIRMIDWIYVDDVASALIHMMEAPGIDGQSIDIGSGKSVSIKEIVKTLVKLIDPSISPKFGAVNDRPMEQERNAKVEETFQKIGWRANTDLKTGLQKTIEYYSNFQPE